MIEMLDIGLDSAIAYRVEGKITEEEMKAILSVLKARVRNNQKINIYQEVVSFGGVEFDAIVEKFKFLTDIGLSNFNKIAVVTHKKWIHKLVNIEDKLFKNIDMKGFSIDEKEKAIDYLKQA